MSAITPAIGAIVAAAVMRTATRFPKAENSKLKALGKSADRRTFKVSHDKASGTVCDR
jgi:hypothetical protein